MPIIIKPIPAIHERIFGFKCLEIALPNNTAIPVAVISASAAAQNTVIFDRSLLVAKRRVAN